MTAHQMVAWMAGNLVAPLVGMKAGRWVVQKVDTSVALMADWSGPLCAKLAHSKAAMMAAQMVDSTAYRRVAH